jgi:aquaporin Z
MVARPCVLCDIIGRSTVVETLSSSEHDMTRYLTEFTGTFFLVFVIGLSVVGGSALAPLAIGSILMAAVYMGGHISGAHYNPAVTLGVALRGKCPWWDVVPYWIAQLIGGGAAATIVFLTMNAAVQVRPGTEYSTGTGLWFALVVEALFTFALVLVVFNVATCAKTAGNSYYGLAIGFTILAGAAAGGPISGGAFNPAVGVTTWLIHAVTSRVFDFTYVWIYLVGPLVGAVLAAVVFRVQCAEEFKSE